MSPLAATMRFRARGRRLTRRRVTIWHVGWICVAAAMILSAIGIAAIHVTAPSLAKSQIVFLVLAVATAAVVATIDPRWLQRSAVPIFIGVMILLVIVLIPWMPSWLVRPRNGARRWLSLVVTDVQPSELAKVAYVLLLASYLRLRANYRRLRGLLPPLILGLIPMALVVVEPDLGTALLFLPTFFAVLLAAGARYRDLAIILLIGGAGAVAMYPLLNTYQKNRVEAVVHQLLGDDRHVQGIGYQGAKAISLIGAGGVTGVEDVDPATLIAANHLPEAHNDMVFAVIATGWGLVGITVTWVLYLALLGGGLLVASLSRDPFGRLVSVGIVAVLFAQMVVNTGMTVGVLPITGMTLPFVSAGGSSLVTAWLMIGLLVGVARRRPKRMGRRSFEFGG